MSKRLEAYKTGETFLDGGKLAYVVDIFQPFAHTDAKLTLVYRHEDRENVLTVTMPASTVL